MSGRARVGVELFRPRLDKRGEFEAFSPSLTHVDVGVSVVAQNIPRFDLLLLLVISTV